MCGSTRLRGQRALRAWLATALVWLAACSDDTRATNRAEDPAYTGEGAFLDACDDGRDCQAGLCLGLETGAGICTHTCKRAAECPRGANWGCGDTTESETAVCVCVADGSEERCGDGRDNDCDGKLDDCLVCGARLVQPNDRLNCGACGNECPAGAVCDERACVCPDGAAGCETDPNVACREDGDCDDHVACTADVCVDGGCSSKLDAASCGAGTSCDPRAALCVAGPVCASDEDCADDDACTIAEHCDAGSRRCVYEMLDGDADGHAPVACGGDDCADDDGAVLPGGVESCDGRDNDCDGAADDGLFGEACGDGLVCTLQGCECGPGHSLCGDECVALATNDAHCGACGNACAGGSVCIDGLCDCAPEDILCRGECRAAPEFAADPLNCGGCGLRCADGEACDAGVCVCAAGTEACAGSCVSPAEFAGSTAHCGACGNACDAAGELCIDGACVCGEDTRACDGACIDVRNSVEHCGACGNHCAGACVEGGCATVAAVVTSFASSCALFDDGRAVCFGRAGGPARTLLRDDNGQPIIGIVQIALNDSAAGSYLCARLGSGALYCGGDPLLRELEDATRLSRVYTTGLVPLGGVADVALGSDASCARLADGRVFCWGPNAFGGTGSGVRGASAIARLVQLAGGGVLDDAAAISLAPYLGQACAARRDGTAVCWGANERGEAQPGALASLLTAVSVRDAEGAALTGVRQVAVGAAASCAMRGDGSVACWGANERGQLGRTALGPSAFPDFVRDAAGNIFFAASSLHANYGTFCALGAGGALACWGNNDQGQLGDGSVEVRRHAVPVLAGVEGLALAVNHACALRADGDVLCWGGSARQGSAASPQSITLYPQPLRDAQGAALVGVRQVAVGGQHSCLVDAAGKVACWGDNSFGQAGGNDGVPALTPRPLPGW